MASAASCDLLRLHLPFPNTHTHSFPSLSPLRPLSSSRRHFPALSAPGAGPTEPVVEPALKHANVLCFLAGYNVQIVADEEESEEALLRRFRREVSKAGVIQECKRRRFFENKQEEKKRKHREACRRNRRRSVPPSPKGAFDVQGQDLMHPHHKPRLTLLARLERMQMITGIYQRVTFLIEAL